MPGSLHSARVRLPGRAVAKRYTEYREGAAERFHILAGPGPARAPTR